MTEQFPYNRIIKNGIIYTAYAEPLMDWLL